MKEKIIVIGSGGHARSVIDALLDNGSFDVIGVVSSDKEEWDGYRGIPWLGDDSAAKRIYEQGCSLAALGIGFLGGSSRLREELVNYYETQGFVFPTIVDPSSIVSAGADIGKGVFLGKGCIINANASVGDYAIINSGALVEHDCTVGDFSHVAVRACLCGGVSVGDYSLIGANATVLQQKAVGSFAIVGAGALVISSVPDGVQAIGLFKGIE